jgi:DNA adenine methylase
MAASLWADEADPPLKAGPPLKWHGGKHYVADLVLREMPRHVTYVEPFLGGGQVLFRRDPDDRRLWLSPHKGVTEIANDIDARLMTFYRVLQDERLFERFRRRIDAVPFSEAEWVEARARLSACAGEPADADAMVDRAVWLFVCCRQSMAGRMKSFTPPTVCRTRRGMSNETSAWLTAVEGLPAAKRRLGRVYLLCRPAVQVIKQCDRPETLFYCDPPYPHETRTARDVYAHEMTDADHRELLDVLLVCQGKVILSGYDNRLYAEKLAGWRRLTKDLANHAAGGEAKRTMTEVLWFNW